MAFFGRLYPQIGGFLGNFIGLTFSDKIVNDWRRSESDSRSSSELICQFWFLTKNSPVIYNFNEKVSWI
jgi:hypothetical protein